MAAFDIESIFTRMEYAKFIEAVKKRDHYEFVYGKKERIYHTPIQAFILKLTDTSATMAYGKIITFIPLILGEGMVVLAVVLIP